MGMEFSKDAAVTREMATVMLSRTVFQVPDAVTGITLGKSVFGYYNEAPVGEVYDVALKDNYTSLAMEALTEPKNKTRQAIGHIIH